MRDTHYIIFCHPKKQLIILEVVIQWKLLTKYYVMGVAHIMNRCLKHGFYLVLAFFLNKTNI